MRLLDPNDEQRIRWGMVWFPEPPVEMVVTGLFTMRVEVVERDDGLRVWSIEVGGPDNTP